MSSPGRGVSGTTPGPSPQGEGGGERGNSLIPGPHPSRDAQSRVNHVEPLRGSSWSGGGGGHIPDAGTLGEGAWGK